MPSAMAVGATRAPELARRAGQATARELRAFCRERLARFKVPRDFVFRDSLPKGGTGKILKAELREPFWQGKEKRVQGI